MKRKCDLCENEATVHDVMIRQGQKVEKHLCEACAREAGISVGHAPVSDLITKFVMAQSGAAPKQTAACPSCGLTFGEFRQGGLLGCPECYRAFEAQLGPLLERAHEGGTHHTGRRPRRAGEAPERHERIAALRRQLSEAIAAEQYERAASLRDMLMGVEKTSAPPPGEQRPRARRRGKDEP